MFCAIVLVFVTLWPDARTGLADPRVMLAAASSITLVGIVYLAASRGLCDPTGLDQLADRLLHDIMPLLFDLGVMLAVLSVIGLAFVGLDGLLARRRDPR